MDFMIKTFSFLKNSNQNRKSEGEFIKAKHNDRSEL